MNRKVKHNLTRKTWEKMRLMFTALKTDFFHR